MAFCKVCSCGEKIVFARRMSYPDDCPSCGRRIADFPTYLEDAPEVEDLIKKAKAGNDNDDSAQPPTAEESFIPTDLTYYLHLPNGRDIYIPQDSCIVGRTEVGAEELAEYSSVSRKHIRITPRRSIGIIIEDISKYGTLVDGNRIEKNILVRVQSGSTITLCNVDAQLLSKE